MHTAQKIVNVKSLYLWYNTDVAAVTKSDHLYTGEVTYESNQGLDQTT